MAKEVKEILKSVGIENTDPSSLTRYMEAQGYSPNAIRKANRGFQKYLSDPSRNFVIDENNTFRVYNESGQDITRDGRTLGNSVRRNLADLVGLGTDVSRFMGIVNSISKQDEQKEEVPETKVEPQETSTNTPEVPIETEKPANNKAPTTNPPTASSPVSTKPTKTNETAVNTQQVVQDVLPQTYQTMYERVLETLTNEEVQKKAATQSLSDKNIQQASEGILSGFAQLPGLMQEAMGKVRKGTFGKEAKGDGEFDRFMKELEKIRFE